MSEKVGDAFVELGVRDRQFDAKMGRAGSKLSKLGGKFKAFKRNALIIGTVLAAGAGLALRGLAEQETAVARLGAVVKATGQAAGFTAGQMREQAAALTQVAAFSEEAVLESQAILATFKQIKGDVFKDATVAILDMATVLKQDAKQGAIQLGKALNDPIKGVTALSRVGVSFTKSQMEQIKALAESNKVMEAQRIILAELESEFGGAAAAAADTLGGRAFQLKEAFDGLGESIVTSLAGTDSMKNTLLTLTVLVEDLTSSIEQLSGTSSKPSGLKKFLQGAIAPFQILAGFAGSLAGGSSLAEAALAGLDAPRIAREGIATEVARRRALADAGAGGAGLGVPGDAAAKAKPTAAAFVGFADAIKKAQEAANKKSGQDKLIDEAKKQNSTSDKIEKNTADMAAALGELSPVGV